MHCTASNLWFDLTKVGSHYKLTHGAGNLVPLLASGADPVKRQHEVKISHTGWMLFWAMHASVKFDFSVAWVVSTLLVNLFIAFPIMLKVVLTTSTHASIGFSLSLALGLVALLRSY
jgi:hypothetical protein